MTCLKDAQIVYYNRDYNNYITLYKKHYESHIHDTDVEMKNNFITIYLSAVSYFSLLSDEVFDLISLTQRYSKSLIYF